MKLTQQQIDFFDTFGYMAFPGVFADDIEKITDSFEQVWTENGGGHFGKAHDHERRSALIQFIDQNEYLSALIDDPRIDLVITSLLGEDYNYSGSDGNYYVGDTQWHSDGYREKSGVSLKMALYLDPVDKDSGCLRVIPGSHKYGDKFGNALEEVRVQGGMGAQNRSEELWGIPPSEVPAVALESQPGDLVMFNHCIKHSSWGGGTSRRMFTINFEERYAEENLDQLREAMASETRFWIERNYGETIVRTASPERMVHLEQRLANDDHMAELARQKREEMEEPSRG